MSKRSHAANKPGPSGVSAKALATENLLPLEGNSIAPELPNELNNKIGKIDADLDDLRSELSKTNKGVKSRLSHLCEKGSDLTSKVSEAYQQLGALDNAYKSLADRSSHISKEIKAIAKQIVHISEKSDSDIGLLSEGYQALIERTDELAKKSKRTTQTLNKSIKDNAKMLSGLENQLLAEIDTLAKTTQKRDQDLGDKTDEISQHLDKAEKEIKSGQARLLKLQAVDQALEKRVTTVETSAGELTKKSRELSRSTTVLNQRTSQLSFTIEELQATSKEHSGLIANLQERAEKTARALVSLIMLEKRHFRILSGMIALLALAMLAFLVHENSNWESEAQRNASLQGHLNSNADQIATTQGQVVELDSHVSELGNEIQVELATVNHKLVAIGDQVESLDGRVSNMRPHRTFGNDNVIHGQEWLAQQPADHYTIHLATTADKQELYKIAERYHNRLNDELAYLPVMVDRAQRYALLYGNYKSQNEADATLNQLPRIIQRRRPSVHSMKQVQAFLSN